MGTRALEHGGQPLGRVMEGVLSLRAQRASNAAGLKQRKAKALGARPTRRAIVDGARLGDPIEIL